MSDQADELDIDVDAGPEPAPNDAPSTRTLLFVDGVYFVGWFTSSTAEDDDESRCASSMEAVPARLLGCHVLSPIFSRRAIRPNLAPGRLTEALESVAEALARELAGDTIRAEHLWPFAHEALGNALRSTATRRQLEHLARDLAIDDIAAAVDDVVMALDHELLPWLHRAILCADHVGHISVRTALHSSWARQSARGHVPDLKIESFVPAPLWHEARAQANSAQDWEALLLGACVAFMNLEPMEKWRRRGDFSATVESLPVVARSTRLPRAVQVVNAVEAVVVATAPSTRAFNALALANLTIGRRLAANADLQDAAVPYLAQAAALVPEHQDPRDDLVKLRQLEEQRAGLREALAAAEEFLASDTASALGRARQGSARLDFCAALALSPTEENLELIDEALEGRAQDGIDAFVRVLKGVVGADKLERVSQRIANLAPSTTHAGLAAELPTMTSRTHLTLLGEAMVEALRHARRLRKPTSNGGFDRDIARNWLRSERGTVSRVAAALGVIMLVGSLLASGAAAARSNGFAQSHSAFLAARSSGDPAKIRAAASDLIPRCDAREAAPLKLEVARTWQTTIMAELRRSDLDDGTTRTLLGELATTTNALKDGS